ncbi:MAG: fused MFS/spermidine synthase [Candidatus Omnitrophica bacterium]|nr:fused MFS/spermidine synthase [Candidatus Omnitrophota bacterium]
MKKNLFFALILMGFTSLVVQTLLIREFLVSFLGNELTIGIIMANWIILEATGSSICGSISSKAKNPSLIYALLQAGIAVYLPLSIFIIRNIKNLAGINPAEGLGSLPILGGSFFVLLPLSFLDGAQFPFGCRLLSDSSRKSVGSAGKVYILEATGFILAGPLFTYLLITKLNSFSVAFCLGLLNLISALLLLKDKLKEPLIRFFFILLNFLLLLLSIINFGMAEKIHLFSIKKQWQKQEVLNYQNSIYGNLVVTKSQDQYTFYSDGVPLITTPIPDIASIEERVHLTILNHPHPKDILLLGGGAGGVIQEILKYPVERLTYIELDPLLIKLIKEFPTKLTEAELKDKRLEIKHLDGRRFLKITKSRYDVVIMNLPIPSTLQLNRFYTKEFFQDIKKILNERGVFGFSLVGSLSYLNPQARNLNGSILNTLKDIFYVNIIPGDFNLYLCSPKEFKIDPHILLNRLKEKNIPTQVLSEYHLKYRLHPRWLEWFLDSLADYYNLRKNYDLLPSATFYSVAYWNSIFSPKLERLFLLLDRIDFKIVLFWIILSGLGFISIMFIFPRLKYLSVGMAIATTGFFGMSFDLILIYTYQAFYGFVFSHIGLLVTAFMAGLALGGYLMNRNLEKIKKDIFSFSRIELKMIGFSLLTGVLLLYLNGYNSPKLSFIFFILSGISGYLVGSEFPLANKISSQNKNHLKTAGTLYALDLAGAYFAALIVSISLVPVIGIIKTCLLLAIIKVISLSGIIFYPV